MSANDDRAYEELMESIGCGSEPKAMVGGAYEATNRMDRALTMWQAPTSSADGSILGYKEELDNKSLDISRNDAYVRGGSEIHKDNIVGSQFVLNAKPNSLVLFGKEDSAWEEEAQLEIESKFNLMADSPEAWLDASRRLNFTEMVRLVVGSFVPTGEMLGTVEWIREQRRPCSTAIQMVDIARLSQPRNKAETERLRGGVETDFWGRPIAYHIRTQHPGDFWANRRYNEEWKRVEARKPWGRKQVIHIFEQERPEQTRGVAAMVAALKEMRTTKKFRDIVLQNAVINATYAASIESELPSDQVFRMLGGGPISDDAIAQAIQSYGAGFMQVLNSFMGSSKNTMLDGAKIPHLFPGTKLQLRPAGQGGPLGTDFETSLLRYIAAALGVSYEQLSRDYTKTNYSSARAAMVETWKYMQGRKKFVADRFATEVYRLWLEEMINGGQIEAFKRQNFPSWYEGLNADAISACDWIGASRYQIDEYKETQAAALRISAGLSTAEQEIAMLGGDFRKVYKQLEREKKMRVSMNILTEIDMKTTPSLIKKTQPAPANNGGANA